MMIVVIIAAVVGLIALWRVQYGVAALVMVLPSYLIRASLAGVPTTALEVSLYAVTFALFIHIIRRRNGFGGFRLPAIAWIFFGVWSTAWVIAALASTDHQASLGALKAWWFDASLFGGVLLYAIRTSEDRALLIRAVLLSGLAVSLAGLAQLIWFRSTLQDGRLSSWFHPVANYAAMYLGPIFILGLGLVLRRMLRSWWWAAVALIGLAIVLTVSFAGYLAVGVGAMLLWWWQPAGQWKRRLGWAAVALAILAAIIVPRTKYFSEHFRTTDRSSGLVRTQIWVTSWALIQQHPIFGIGPNTFESNYRAEILKHYFPPLEWLVAQPHNLYLALWLETGLLGVLTFVGLMTVWIRAVWRRMRQSEGLEQAVYACSLAAVIAVLVHGLFDTPYFKNDLAIEFTLLILLPWIGKMSSPVRQ